MSGPIAWWRATKRVLKSQVLPGAETGSEPRANEAYESGLWEESATLWEEIFEDTADPKERRFAGRRAALSYRKAANFGDARRLLRALIDEFPEDRDTRRELARFELEQRLGRARDKYWHRRKRLLYIQVSKEIAQRIASNANAVLDVGSHGTPILSWFPEVPVRVSVDIRNPYRAEDVEAVEADFLTWDPGQRFDVVLCLQVLEHVHDASAFAQRLLATCDVLIVSVPYKWSADASRYHFHDPVDEQKMRGWFGRDPNYSYRVAELHGQERLICVYDTETEERWDSIPVDRFRFRWSLRGVDELLADDL